jgi:hypothetical protein
MDVTTHEACFGVPEGLVDFTLNRLVYKRPNGDLQVVVGRVPAQGRSLEQVVDARVRDQQRSIPYLAITGRSSRQVANRQAIQVTMTFVDRGRQKYQRSVSVAAVEKVIVLAVLGPTERRDEIDAMYETAVASLSFRATETRAP